MRQITKVLSVGLVAAGASVAQAGTFYDTNASGDWGTATNWTPNGVPVSGDWIKVDQTMTVASDQSFGDNTGSNASTFGQYGLTINPGVVLTHVAGSTLNVNSGNNAWAGGGTFINNGTFTQSFRGNIGAMLFQNNGVYEQTAGNWTAVNTGATFRMGAGSTYRTSGAGTYDLSGAGSITSVDAGDVLQAVNFDISSGNLRFTNTGTGQIKLASLSVASGSYLHLASPNITYSSDNANIFNVDGQIRILGHFRAASDFHFNPTEGFLWTGGNLYTNGNTITVAAGNTVTANTTIYGDGSSGKYVNNGTFQINFRPAMQDGATFENNALIDIVAGAGFMNYNGTINNTATGSIVKGPTSGANSFSFSMSSGNPAFINNGLVEVNSGTINLNTNLDTTQFFDVASKTLTHGTWKVAPDTVATATLTIGDASSPKITTIGTNATVILENAGATFSYLDATLTTIHGKLLVNGTKNLSNANVITVGSTGTLGGNGTLTVAGINILGTLAPGASAGNLIVAGPLELAADSSWEIEIADPAGSAGIDWDLLTVTGSLTLPASGTLTLDILALAPTAGDNDFSILIASAASVANFNPGQFLFSFNPADFSTGSFSVEKIGNDLYLNYIAIPEPASLALMALGGAFILHRRRKA